MCCRVQKRQVCVLYCGVRKTVNVLCRSVKKKVNVLRDRVKKNENVLCWRLRKTVNVLLYTRLKRQKMFCGIEKEIKNVLCWRVYFCWPLASSPPLSRSLSWAIWWLKFIFWPVSQKVWPPTPASWGTTPQSTQHTTTHQLPSFLLSWAQHNHSPLYSNSRRRVQAGAMPNRFRVSVHTVIKFPRFKVYKYVL